MTDPRAGDLIGLMRRLPPGTGVVFRHYQLAPHERHALFRRARAVARARRLVLLRAGAGYGEWGTDGGHNRFDRGLRTHAVHNARQARRAADAHFVSPLLATRSHPGAKPLGLRRANALIGSVPAIALGGVGRGTRLSRRWHGYAAIDDWLQKRKDVPR